MPVPPAGPRPRTRRGGFTLIELMIVVFIISVLIGLTVAVIPRVYRAAHGAQTSAELSAIAAAIQVYYGDYRAYPGPIPNGQIGGAFYGTAVNANVTSLGATSASGTTFSAGGFGSTQQQHITGTENLVLGLLGGLEYDANNSAIAYNPNDIFPDGSNPAPKGAMVLNPNLPKRSPVYYQVKAGDLSGGSFKDDALRPASDSMIPEFVDKFSRPMPILYLRANVGASGVVSLGGKDGATTATYQYDLAQVLGYTSTAIGTLSATLQSHHGLQGIVPTGGTIKDTVYSTTPPYGDWGSGGANALPYLADPNTPALQPDGTTATTNALAHPRQKDAFILISAGPDGIYGTTDDVIYPGGSIAGQ